MQTPTTPPAPPVIRIFLAAEGVFRTAASAVALEESLVDSLPRFLALQKAVELDTFFWFLRHQALELIPACNWLVPGPKLARGSTLWQLLRLIELVRERRPDVFDFSREILAARVLAKVAGMKAGTATPLPSTHLAVAE